MFGLVTTQHSLDENHLLLPLSTSAGNHKKTVSALGDHCRTPGHHHSHRSVNKRVHELLRMHDLPDQRQSGAGNGRHNYKQNRLMWFYHPQCKKPDNLNRPLSSLHKYSKGQEETQRQCKIQCRKIPS